MKKEKELLIKSKNGIVDNAHFYGFVMIMKRLLTIDDFKELKSDIIKLTENIHLCECVIMDSAKIGKKNYKFELLPRAINGAIPWAI